MNDLLAIAGIFTALYAGLSALKGLIKYIFDIKRGGKNKIQKTILDVIITHDEERDHENEIKQAQQTKELKEFIKSENKPIVEQIELNNTKLDTLTSATIEGTRQRLKNLYYDEFEKNGFFSNIGLKNWNALYQDYVILGGNGEIKLLNEEVQTTHKEIAKRKREERLNKNDI